MEYAAVGTPEFLASHGSGTNVILKKNRETVGPEINEANEADSVAVRE